MRGSRGGISVGVQAGVGIGFVLMCVAAIFASFTFVTVNELQRELKELRIRQEMANAQLASASKHIQNELQSARQVKTVVQVAEPRECPPCHCEATQKQNSNQQQQVAVIREEKVKTLLRWMGVDGGKDIFNVFVLWDKLAKANNGLIVEVGAGDGRQASKAASIGWNVISVDANQDNLELGKGFLEQAKNQSKSFTGSVQWKWFAVSNYSGEAQFYGDVGMGRLLDGQQGDVTDPNNSKWARKTTSVQVRRLDDIVGDVEPFMLKIDVEGHELNVLRGATKLLAKKPKVIIVEWNPVMMEWAAKADAFEVLKILHDLGYDLYDTAISEPKKKGFLEKYPGFHRPTGFRELVDYFKKSAEFDWWGSWTDIIAVDPTYA